MLGQMVQPELSGSNYHALYLGHIVIGPTFSSHIKLMTCTPPNVFHSPLMAICFALVTITFVTISQRYISYPFDSLAGAYMLILGSAIQITYFEEESNDKTQHFCKSLL